MTTEQLDLMAESLKTHLRTMQTMIDLTWHVMGELDAMLEFVRDEQEAKAPRHERPQGLHPITVYPEA